MHIEQYLSGRIVISEKTKADDHTVSLDENDQRRLIGWLWKEKPEFLARILLGHEDRLKMYQGQFTETEVRLLLLRLLSGHPGIAKEMIHEAYPGELSESGCMSR